MNGLNLTINASFFKKKKNKKKKKTKKKKNKERWKENKKKRKENVSLVLFASHTHREGKQRKMQTKKTNSRIIQTMAAGSAEQACIEDTTWTHLGGASAMTAASHWPRKICPGRSWWASRGSWSS